MTSSRSAMLLESPSHECVEFVEKLRAIFCCFALLFFGVIPLSHAAENDSKVIPRTKRTVLIPDCDNAKKQVNSKLNVSRVVLDYFSLNQMHTIKRTYVLNKKSKMLVSKGYYEHKDQLDGSVFVNEVGTLSPQWVRDLLARAQTSLSNCSFALQERRLAFTVETAAEFRKAYGFDPPQLTDAEKLPITHRDYSPPFRASVGTTDEQGCPLSTSGMCAGSIPPPGYIMTIRTDLGTTKLCCPEDLPCVIVERAKIVRTYDIGFEKDLERFFVVARMPGWIQRGDEEFWEKRIQKFWSSLASSRRGSPQHKHSSDVSAIYETSDHEATGQKL